MLNKPNWTDLSLPHSSCFRWWSIGLLRYTHAPLILHRFTVQSHPLCYLSFLSCHHLFFFHFHSTAWCKRDPKEILWFIFPNVSLYFVISRGQHARLTRMAKLLPCVPHSGTAHSLLLFSFWLKILFFHSVCMHFIFSFFPKLYIHLITSSESSLCFCHMRALEKKTKQYPHWDVFSDSFKRLHFPPARFCLNEYCADEF